MAGRCREKWLGGYIRNGKAGPTYMIERWLNGTHFHVSTRCRTLRAALKQLEAFEADPIGYNPRTRVANSHAITADLVLEYRKWMEDRKKDSPEWARTVARMLGQWIEDLGGRDIRALNVQRDIKPALDRRKTSRKHRIEALKAFCGWLRTEKGLLKMSEDPTLDLVVPQDDPAQHHRRRAVDPAVVAQVLPFLDEEVRDVLNLLAGTGWHISEVRRFARSGELLTRPDGLTVALTRHKSKRMHATLLQHAQHIQAARGILARKDIPAPWTLSVAMKEACAAAGVEQFRMGVMRHTVASNAVNVGTHVEDVSAFLGHASKRTTERFYVDMNIPAKSVPVLKLVKEEPVQADGPTEVKAS